MHDHGSLLTGLGVTLSVDARGTYAVADGALQRAIVARNLRHVRTASFPARTLALAEVRLLGDVELAVSTDDGFACVLAIDAGTVVAVTVTRGRGALTVAAADEREVGPTTEGLLRALRDEDDGTPTLPLTLWTAGPGGSTAARRAVPAPNWPEVRRNYAAATAASLDPLVAATAPGAGGLLLWHGPPGTGKSYAIRALGRAWAPWCDVHVITDPELLLGGGSSATLVGQLGRGDEHRRRHRLLVLEDVGELLGVDAQARAARAVSRLLNLTDGLLGAGLRAVVLVTTNEPLHRLHPALTRPGRCWAQVMFAPLSAQEASGWLGAPVTRPSTLAELYARRDGRAGGADAGPGSPGPIGFG